MENYLNQLPYADQPQIETINSEYELIFGVEFDMIFLFHELLLIHELRKAEGKLDDFSTDLAGERARLIEKLIHEEDRVGMAHPATERRGSHPQYKGWGLRVKPSHELDSIKYSSGNEVRTYSDEPMQIAKEVLEFCPRGLNMDYYQENASMLVYVNTGKEDEGSIQHLGRWSFTNQPGLLGLPKHLVQSYIDHKKLIAGARSLASPHDTALVGKTHFPSDALGEQLPSADDWDSHGIRLRSRVLTFKKGSFAEILDVLETMKGTHGHLHGISVSNRCGSTVHIGRPDNTFFDLQILQHLALLLVTYEGQINSIHPPHCRSIYDPKEPRKSMDEDPSSRYYWQRTKSSSFSSSPGVEPSPLLTRDSNTGKWIPSPSDHQPLSKMRTAIFHPAMTIPKLANLMGASPAKYVDWSNLLPISEQDNQSRPLLRTLVFRQHEGTTDPVHIEWWVLFCASLVRLAHHNAHSKTPPPESENPPTLLSLLSKLSFPASGVEQFSRRAAYYAAHTQPRHPPILFSPTSPEIISPTSTTHTDSSSRYSYSLTIPTPLRNVDLGTCSRAKDHRLKKGVGSGARERDWRGREDVRASVPVGGREDDREGGTGVREKSPPFGTFQV